MLCPFKIPQLNFQNKELDDFKINIDSHYDLFQDDPDYGIYLKISNVN